MLDNITQDITFSVQEANDDPVITTTGLTQIIVDENTGFVVDIDVSDQDSEAHHYDLLYHTSDQEIRYFSHTGDYSSLSNSYTTGSWTDVDDTLSPSFLYFMGILIRMATKISYYSRSLIMKSVT